MYPTFEVKFYIFDRSKTLTDENEDLLIKTLNNMEDIVKYAMDNIDMELCILNRAEAASLSTLDSKKQLRTEIYVGKDKLNLYDRHCIHFVQHGEELFTIEELLPIIESIKNELYEYLHYEFDTEIYVKIF